VEHRVGLEAETAVTNNFHLPEIEPRSFSLQSDTTLTELLRRLLNHESKDSHFFLFRVLASPTQLISTGRPRRLTSQLHCQVHSDLYQNIRGSFVCYVDVV
jgi:hypothetical protein